MRRIRCWAAVGLVVLLAGGLLIFTGPVAGQVKMEFRVAQPGQPFPGGPVPPITKAPPGVNPAALYSGIKLTEESKYREFINAANDCIKDAVLATKKGEFAQANRDWNQAAEAIQTVLNLKEDFHVTVRQRDPQGQDTVRWASVKFEANNLLGAMPKEGLEVYEVRYGGEAKKLLDDAKTKGDRELLADVATRFAHTKAGIEANEILATFFLDRGQFFMASLRYERLLDMNSERVKVDDLMLFKAALAYRRAGEIKQSEALWKKLEASVFPKGGLKIGEHVIPIARLHQALQEVRVPEAAGIHDWPMIRGDTSNAAQAVGSQPLLDMPLWRRPLLQDGEVEERADKGEEAKKKVKDALDRVGAMQNTPVLPGGFPIAVGKLLLYRTYSDVRAVSLREEKDASGKVVIKPGDFIWKTTDLDGGLANVLDKDSKVRSMVDMWLSSYLSNPTFANLAYENTLNGTISTDHRHLYVVDDLAVPAPISNFQQFNWNQSNLPMELKNLVMGNSLQAYDMFQWEGKLVWRKGDPIKKDANDPFADSHFLGPPISVGGKLYILNEKNNAQPTGDADLRLVCLDPLTGNVLGPMQSLGSVLQNYRITHDISRRINAVHLGYGEGILVCPTNAGQVLGVDLLSRTLAWAYPYRESAPTRPNVGNPGMIGPGFGPGGPGMPGGINPVMPGVMNVKWKSAPPVISEGKVVFTAPDADSIHCINLRDGWKAWSKRRDESADDLFLGGVYNGKVVVVGKNAVRLLKLSTGDQVAYLPTGDMPSGQGVASKNVYYLPLKKGEICAIDLERNTIKAHNRSSKTGAKAPGNLIFHEGAVISQTPEEIIAYPQLTARLELATKAVEADPSNPEKLYDRGVYRLADGQVQGAVDDLRDALKFNPGAELTGKVKKHYYEALTDLFQSDFTSASSKYLDDFRELSKAPDNPDDKEQRQARFFRIVGQGRENQGNLVEAYDMYKDFARLSINQQGVANIDDPTRKVPTSVWLKGRIAGMMAKASGPQREPLEAKIAEEWKIVKAKSDVDDLRKFVGMFDVPFGVGREARLHLAEAITAKNDTAAYLEAELNLEQLRVGEYRADPRIGGRALAGLVALELKKGKVENMKLAAAYCRELARDFGDTVVADGKTGKDFLNRLAELPPRYFPYLEEGGPFWKDAKIAAREVNAGSLPAPLQGFILYPEGDLTPGMKNLRIILDPSNSSRPRARLIDMSTGSVRWELDVLPKQPNQATYQFFTHLYPAASAHQHYRPDARFRLFQVKGHLAVLQLGPHAFGIDLNNPRVLWQHDLLQLPPNVQIQQPPMFDAEGHFEVVVWNPFTQQRTVTRVGSVGAVEASYVALVTQKGLVVLDPLRGTELWSKTDVPPRTKVFGDNEHLYLLETHDGGSATAGRCLRASDGAVVNVEDFGSVYLNRVRLEGRRILAAIAGRDNLTLRLYDVVAGKDLWSKTFDAKAVVLRTDDPGLTGVIEPDGKVVVLDAASGRELMTTSALQKFSDKVESRITSDALKMLAEPLLLADADRFYVALNHLPDHNQIAGGVISSNFSNGLRCAPVNGWFMAFHRKDGERRVDGQVKEFKKGDLAWYSDSPMSHQMIVLEQFDNLPVILFSSRYHRVLGGGATGQWLSVTRTLDKKFGRAVFSSERQTNGQQPQFHGFSIDLKAGTISMINLNASTPNGSVLHYIDDGRKVPGTEVRSDNTPGPAPLPPGGLPMFPRVGPGGGLVPAPPPLPPPPLRDGRVVPAPVIRQLDLPPK